MKFEPITESDHERAARIPEGFESQIYELERLFRL
jgi:hypothetical protein